MKLSVFLIVRDESKVLERCILSLRGLQDELVVVDTGSQDDTISIARRHTSLVYEIPWENDFSKAWNYAMDRCTGDWLFVMAADQLLGSEPADIRHYLQETPHTVVDFRIRHGSLEYHYPRVFRSNLGYKFVGPVHEYLSAPQGVKSDFLILHERPGKTDRERNLKILMGAERTPRNLFYLGRECYDLGKYTNSIAWLSEYLPRSTWDAEKAEALYTMALCYRALADYPRAKRSALQALSINPAFSAPYRLLNSLDGKAAWLELAKAANDSNTLFRWN